MSIMIHEIKIFDAIDEGIDELYGMYHQTWSTEARYLLSELIDSLEQGDVTARLLIWVNDDGSVSPLVMGGDAVQRRKVAKDFGLTVKESLKQYLH